ncbi:MAG: diaminopimelate epimerase [Deltaproteobacteria bacterium]|jgi:diaminopimelate epimerase|nr:diaminopimelate epimerase [Deltaproteobacteria bacterium]
MDDLKFFKYSGHGNDFVIIDNWDWRVPEYDLVKVTKLLARDKYGIGADGVVYISEGPEEVDFAVRFFNSDGSEADMCGNASRCVAHLAFSQGIAPAEMTFLTKAGDIQAFVGDNQVSVRLPTVGATDGMAIVDVDGDMSRTYYRVNTGVSHAVTWVDDVESVNVAKVGRAVRHHPSFYPGANVDFVQILDHNSLAIRTYEIGVEDETLACGTGCTASALLSLSHGYLKGKKVVCKTRGGEDLIVRVEGSVRAPSDVYLEGAVRFIFSGNTGPDITRR